ncbi:MAG: SDR family oxidoreductase [Patescibacteria group bacterium]
MKTAIITGATSGIGKAIIEQLIKKDYSIIAIGRNDQALADLEALSPHVKALKCDLSHNESIFSTIAYLRNNCERVSTLIHCAGVWHNNHKPLANMKLQDFTENEVLDTISVGLTSFMLLVRALIPKMIQDESSIIAISGTFENGGKGWLPYFVSKRGLEDFMVGLADELKEANITANTISPSDTATSAYKRFFPEYIEDSVHPASIAELAMELMTSKKTGATLIVKKDSPLTEQFHG